MSETGGGRAPSRAPEKLSFDVDEFELDSMRCPHCGASHWVRCGRCESFVCDGRSEPQKGRLYFRCTVSCGNDGLTTTLERVEAYKPAGPLALTKQSPLLRLRDMR